MTNVTRTLKALKTGVELIGVFWFLVMFGAFIIQVFTRYVLNAPLGWTTEVSLIAYLWFAFWGAGLMASEKDHVRFDMIYQVVSNRAKRALSLIAMTVLAGVFIYSLPANVDFVHFMAEDVTWVLEIRFDLVFAVFIIFMVGFAARCLWRGWRLTRPDWEQEL